MTINSDMKFSMKLLSKQIKYHVYLNYYIIKKKNNFIFFFKNTSASKK